jgi:predicted RNase H-like nuclease (RuvC/YqgF family)
MPITKEDFQEFIKDEDNKEVFLEFAKVIGLEPVDGLKNKRDELLEKLTRSKREKTELQNKLDSIDLEEYSELKENSEKSQSETERLLREFKKAQTDLQQSSELNQRLESEINNGLIKTDLFEALTDAGVDPVHIPILSSHFKSKATVEMEDNSRKVVIDNGSGLGQNPKEYLKEWAENQGQPYLKKPENSGAQSHKFEQGNSQKGQLGATPLESLNNIN